MYLDSTKVKVFPTAYRGKNDGKIFDPESRLNTEKNLTKIATKITSHDSFVVNRDFELSSGETEKLEVCLKGYLFELTLTPNDLSSFETNGSVYASIKVEAKNTSYDPSTNADYEGLSLSPFGIGQTILDASNGDFIGLDLSSTMESGEDKFLILEYKNNKWVVPTSSILSLDTKIVEDGLNSGKSIKEELHTGDIWLNNRKADTNEYWGLSINDNGQISSIDLAYSDTKPSGNEYSFIDGLTETSNGWVGTTRHTIPDASASQKGLVNTGPQSYSGPKEFKDGIFTNGVNTDNISNNNEDLKINSDMGIAITTTDDSILTYNGNEIATIDYMENEGVSHSAIYTSFTNNQWYEYPTKVTVNNQTISLSFEQHPELKKRCLFRLEKVGTGGARTRNYRCCGILESCFYVQPTPFYPSLDSVNVYSPDVGGLDSSNGSYYPLRVHLWNYYGSPSIYNDEAQIKLVCPGVWLQSDGEFWISWKPID